MVRKKDQADFWHQMRISNDYIFGTVMQRRDNGLKMLQAIFPQLAINQLKQLTWQKHIQNQHSAHGVVLDIFAEDDQGRVFDVEMQVAPQAGFWQRIWYYLAQITAASLHRGQHYHQAKDSYLVFIMAYDERHKGKYRYQCDLVCDQDKVVTGTSITLLNSQGTSGTITAELHDVFHLMNGQTSQVTTPFGRQLIQDIDQVKADLGKERAFMDWVTKLNWAKEDAEQRGINRANNNNAIAVARQLHLLGMSEEQIQQNLQAIFGNSIDPNELLKMTHRQDPAK